MAIQEIAKIRVELEGAVEINPAYRTFYYGLRRNHVHHASTIYPILFIARRLLYSLIIVFMVGEVKAFFGTLMLTLTSLATAVFIAIEAPWELPMFNTWSILNEAMVYIVCVSLMCFSGVLTDATQSVSLGWLLIGLIFVMLIYNSTIIIFDALIYARLCILRYRKKFPAKLIKFLLQFNNSNLVKKKRQFD